MIKELNIWEDKQLDNQTLTYFTAEKKGKNPAQLVF